MRFCFIASFIVRCKSCADRLVWYVHTRRAELGCDCYLPLFKEEKSTIVFSFVVDGVESKSKPHPYLVCLLKRILSPVGPHGTRNKNCNLAFGSPPHPIRNEAVPFTPHATSCLEVNLPQWSLEKK